MSEYRDVVAVQHWGQFLSCRHDGWASMPIATTAANLSAEWTKPVVLPAESDVDTVVISIAVTRRIPNLPNFRRYSPRIRKS
jgi:hypothetical protein